MNFFSQIRTLIRIHIIRFFILSAAISLISCEKADEYVMDPQTNFDALWKIIDENYCFFEYKDIDWNEVYQQYNVQLKDSMDQFELFQLLGNMLSELQDGHTNLSSSFDVARYWDWYEDYPRNFDEDLHNKYLGKDYLIAGGMKYRRLADNKIGYIYYDSFSNGVGENNLDYIFYHFKDCQGLIIDVRENGGGTLTYADLIASRFLEEKTLTGYIIHKTGKGHDDFSAPYPVELEPSERIRWFRPVVVLTNRHSYSATNDFVNKMKILPHVTVMGDRTGGGSGLPFNSELPNGWRVRFSASPMLDIDKQHTEYGIEPDKYVQLKQEDVNRGEDTLIEEAIKYLTNQKE